MLTVVILLIAVLVIALAVQRTMLQARELRRTRNLLFKEQQALVESVPASSGSSTPQIYVPDYIDEALLEEIAQQLDIDVGPRAFTSGATSKFKTGSATKLTTEIGVEGVARASAQIGADEELELHKLAVESIQRRPHFKSLVEGVLTAARERDLLVSDLDVVPTSVEPEAGLIQASYVLRHDWGMAPVNPYRDTEDEHSDPESEAGDPSPDSEDEEEDPSDQAFDRVNRALGEVELVALEFLDNATSDRLSKIGENQGQLALVESRWMVTKEPSLKLTLARLKARLSNASGHDLDDVPVTRGISVPISEEHLLSHGQRRFEAASDGGAQSVVATVFGRIEEFDQSLHSLIIYPIAIYTTE